MVLNIFQEDITVQLHSVYTSWLTIYFKYLLVLWATEFGLT